MTKINNELRALFKEIIIEKERDMKLEKTSDDNLLTMLLQSNLKEIQEQGIKCGLSTDEVIEDCKTFYFAGQESTSNLLSWTMILLSIHPSWQIRAREEIWQVLGNNNPDYAGLNHLKIVSIQIYIFFRFLQTTIATMIMPNS